MLIHGSVNIFMLSLLQRNDKREVDNTENISYRYSLRKTCRMLRITNALFLFIEKANSQQGKQNYLTINSYLKHRTLSCMY